MNKGSVLLCLLVPVQVCIVQLCLISSCWQLTAGQTGGKFLWQDPIGRSPRLMSDNGREELDGHSSDGIFDEDSADDGGLVAVPVHECLSDGGGAPVEEEEEEEEVWLPEDDSGGGAKGGSSSGSGGGDVECPECGKFFKNHKSMFGHLRSHPDRGYKGATPPVNKLKLLPEPEMDAVASSSCPSPSRGTHQPRAQRDRPLTVYEMVCTFAMLTLPYRENSQPTQQVPPPPAPAPPSYCESETNVGRAIEHGVGSSNMGAAEAHADQCGGSIVKIPKKRRNMLKGIRDAHRKKAKLLVPPPPPVPKEKVPYICKYCHAEFPTHQALGGHMAGHHRDKKVQTLNDASSSKAQQGMAAQSQDGGNKLQVKGGGDDDNGWRDRGASLRRGQRSKQLSTASNVQRQSGQAPGVQTIAMRQQHSGRRSDVLTPAAPAPAPILTQADDRGGRTLFNIDLNADATEQE